MYGFTPTITFDDHQLLIVGYTVDTYGHNDAYKIPVATFMASIDQQHNRDTPTIRIKQTAANHYNTALVLGSSVPVVAGGDDTDSTPTADIKMYDNSNNSWKKIGSLSSARSSVAVATVYNNAIIIIGGYIKGDTVTNRESSSMTLVELGQAELLH